MLCLICNDFWKMRPILLLAEVHFQLDCGWLSKQPWLGTLTFCLQDMDRELSLLCNGRSMIVASLTFARVRGLDFDVSSPTKRLHRFVGLFPSKSAYKCLHMVFAVAVQIKTLLGLFRLFYTSRLPHLYELCPPSLFFSLSLNQLTPATNNLLPLASSAELAGTIVIQWPTKIALLINQQIRSKGMFYCLVFSLTTCRINKCTVTESRCLAMRLERAGLFRLSWLRISF